MGTADVIPGVSGGTMAFILGIYRQLIEAIKSFDRDWIVSIFRLDQAIFLHRPHFGFLIPLVAGIVTALFFFTRVVSIPLLLRSHPELVYSLFFGLITGSIFVLARQLGQFSIWDTVLIVMATIIGWYTFNLVPAATPDTGWFIFLSGALAICAMILPGISGSFVLLMLKKYATVFNAIGYLEFNIIIPFLLGIITGLALFSRILSWFLNNFYRPTILFILGLLCASLWVIWPFQTRDYMVVRGKEHLIKSVPYLPDHLDLNLLYPALVCILGLLTVLAIDYFAHRQGVIRDVQ